MSIVMSNRERDFIEKSLKGKTICQSLRNNSQSIFEEIVVPP